MLKYFSAEAIMCGHRLYLASADDAPQQILNVSHPRWTGDVILVAITGPNILVPFM